MITEPTVLVLGAGASIGYGFPSGIQLLNEICERCKSRDAIGYAMNLNIHRMLHGLLIELEKAPVQSIDEFLSYQKDFTEAGKFAIAYCLIPYENETALTDRTKRSSSWYQYLFKAMEAPTIEEFLKNKLSIVTFNYDRSIDRFLQSAMQVMYKLDAAKSFEALNHFPIHHVHGQLGSLDFNDKKYWELTNTNLPSASQITPAGGLVRFRPYNNEVNHRALMAAMADLTIIHEGDNTLTMDKFRLANEACKNATRIMFLGFGYHEVNVQRLKLTKIENNILRMSVNAAIGGTCWGMTDAEKNKATRLIPMLGLCDPKFDCLTYLRNSGWF